MAEPLWALQRAGATRGQGSSASRRRLTGSAKTKGGSDPAPGQRLATLSLVNSAELRDVLAVTFVTIVGRRGTRAGNAQRGAEVPTKGRRDSTGTHGVIFFFRCSGQGLSGAAGTAVKTFWAEWVLKNEATELAAGPLQVPQHKRAGESDAGIPRS